MRATAVALAATVAAQAALLLAAYHLLPWPGDADGVLALVVAILAWIAACAVVLVAAPVLVFFGAQLLLPLWNERIFFAALEPADPALAATLAALPAAPVSRSLRRTAGRFMRWLAALAAAGLLGIVPVAGPLLSAAVGGTATAWVLAWELFDPVLDRIAPDPASERAFLARHRWLLLGAGLPWAALVALPFIGPLLFGLVQAAAAHVAAGPLREPILAAAARRGPIE